MTTLRLIKPNTEQQATYLAALKLVATIDANLERGRVHYYSQQGQLLTKLDEVVRAILDNNLLVNEELVRAA